LDFLEQQNIEIWFISRAPLTFNYF
jgi:hypothetical protein